MMSYRRRKMERRVYREQYDKIAERFGHKSADVANYGWSVDGDEDFLSIATKIYRGLPYTVIVSTVDFVNGTINHEWRI